MIPIEGDSSMEYTYDDSPDYPPANAELQACLVCGRTFLPETLVKHVRICERMATKKRKQFDSSKQRLEGTELAAYNMPRKKGGQGVCRDFDGPKPKRRDWKEQHLELVETIRASRLALMEEKRMKEDPNYVPSYKRNSRSGSYEPTSRHGGGADLGSDSHGGSQPVKKRVPAGHDTCPYCDRNFCTKAYDRHVEWCKEKTMIAKQHKPSSQKEAKLNPARERLAARTKYKVPALKTKRAVAREKYSPNGSLAAAQNNNDNNNTTNRNTSNVPNNGSTMNSPHGNSNNNNAHSPGNYTNHSKNANTKTIGNNAINTRNNSSGNLANNNSNSNSPAIGRKQGPLRRSSGASASSMTEMAKHNNSQGPVTGIKGRGDEPSIRRQPSIRRNNSRSTPTKNHQTKPKNEPTPTRNTIKPSTINLKLNFDLTSSTDSVNVKNLQHLSEDANTQINYEYDPFVSAQMQMIELYTPDATESEKTFSETSEKSLKSIKEKRPDTLSLSAILGTEYKTKDDKKEKENASKYNRQDSKSSFYLHDQKKVDDLQTSTYEEDYYIDPVLINDRDGFSTAASDNSSDDTFETYESMLENLDDCSINGNHVYNYGRSEKQQAMKSCNKNSGSNFKNSVDLNKGYSIDDSPKLESKGKDYETNKPKTDILSESIDCNESLRNFGCSKSTDSSPKLNRSKRIELEKFDLSEIFDDHSVKNQLDVFSSPSPNSFTGGSSKKSLDRKRLSKKTRQDMLYASCDLENNKILNPPEEFQVFSTSFDADSGFSTDRDVKQDRLYNDYLRNSPSPQRLKHTSENTYDRISSPTKTCDDFDKLSRTSSPSYMLSRSLRNTPSPERVRIIPIEFAAGKTSPIKNSSRTNSPSYSKSLQNTPSPDRMKNLQKSTSSGSASPIKKSVSPINGSRYSPERIVPIKLSSGKISPIKNRDCVANSSYMTDDSASDKTLDDNSYSLNDSSQISSFNFDNISFDHNPLSQNDSDASPGARQKVQQQQHAVSQQQQQSPQHFSSNKHHSQRRNSYDKKHHSRTNDVAQIEGSIDAANYNGNTNSVSPTRRTAVVENGANNKKNVSADSAYGSLSRSSPSSKQNNSNKNSRNTKDYMSQHLETSDRGDCSSGIVQHNVATYQQNQHNSRNSSINSSPKHNRLANNEDALSSTSGDSLSLTLNKLQLDVQSYNSPVDTDRSIGIRMSKFCHECGSKFPLEAAKFCVECGVKRLTL